MDIPNTNIVYQYDGELNAREYDNGSNVDIESNEEEILKEILLKSNKQNINKGWNDKNENILISIGENCTSYKYMHDRSAQICYRTHKIIKIILIVFSTLLSAMTSVPNSYTCSSGYVTIVMYILTYVVTLLSVLMHFLQNENKGISHTRAASEFSKLYHDIQQQMCLYRRDRIIAFKFLSKIFKTYDSLIVTSPEINESVFNEFKRKFASCKIDLNSIANKMQKIDIISEDNIGGTDETTRDNTIRVRGGIELTNLKIDGDITDKELNTCNPQNIKELRARFFKENATYEYMRFLHNEIDD